MENIFFGLSFGKLVLIIMILSILWGLYDEFFNPYVTDDFTTGVMKGVTSFGLTSFLLWIIITHW
jgi:hypothetical protein